MGQKLTLPNSTTTVDPLNAYGGVAVLNVTPEPSTFALLAVGAIGLLGFAWRRRRQTA
jgi:hypothetical protein